MAINPFKPSAGVSPPLLIGRASIIDEFSEALDNGPGSPMRLARITGARGIGKTVLLNELERRAKEKGWVTISETAYEGLSDRIRRRAFFTLEALDTKPARKKILSGVTLPMILDVGGGGLNWDTSRHEELPDLRESLNRLLTTLEEHQSGCVITIDEVHAGKRSELRELFAVAQHLQREEREIVILMAGLPSAVSDLINDDVLTFMRRADPHELREVEIAEVRQSFKETVEASGKFIAPGALDMAAEATGGYPFLIQLVGYHIWRLSKQNMIDVSAANQGVAAAKKRLGDTVHAPALSELSAIDKTYLVMMARDEGPSSTGAIADRMGESAQYANQYRQRLIDAGIIAPAAFGRVEFTIAGLRDYIRQHAVHLTAPETISYQQDTLF